MSNNTISEYLQIFDKRIFFDIASEGCGNGCVYCFTKNPRLAQSLLPIRVVDELCEAILNLPDCQDSVISFCPNTEPMKSVKSRELIYYAICKLQKNVKSIQIATKEEIPVDFLEQINKIATIPLKIRISVSMPYLDFLNQIEPHAAHIANRLNNFRNIRQFSNLVSILYLRPFNEQMMKNRKRYVEIINKYNPDDICVGAEFVPKQAEDQLCTFMYDSSIAPSIFTGAPIEDIFSFVDFLRMETGRKFFFSSICNIANNIRDYGCILKLYKYDKRYCKDCVMQKDNGYEYYKDNETNIKI